ncbi:hypothetical protein [Streptomyces sp. NBC_00239]|uniref:hypothetical protein n=1 Tax=Streptomyces sp. NBC_00239 TaxID=2903640 RepID=UPI002E2C91F3|nr:hypothetical protein [Streptomyces sp. NBC_00239]
MTVVEYEHPIRKVRDEIASVVDRAKDGGAITYVTRNGERVAAVVPLPVADRGTRPADRTALDSQGKPIRPAPAAPGGRFTWDAGGPSQQEIEWTRAGLEALHAQLATATAETVALLGIVGQALAATSDRHLGTVQELLDSIDRRFAVPEGALSDAVEVYDELTRPDDALCVTCREPINTFYGHEGWQHYRMAVNEHGINATVVYEAEDKHEPEPTFVPRTRRAFADGKVVRPYDDPAAPAAEEE